MAESIKMKIQQGAEIDGQNVYSFILPDETSHQNHIVGLTAAVTETIDPKVRSKIKELVCEGKRNISVITALLEQYVINELGEVDKLRNRFYPQRDSIRNIISAAKREIRWSKIDLENAEQLLKSWKEKSANLSNIYFRPCTIQQDPGEINTIQEESGDEEEEEENQILRWKQTPNNHLLFIYQSKQMKDLYHRYGKNGILLDATYKTCKWAIPLYIVAVRTNVGYQPIAVFITQYETRDAIFEALETIKLWNPEVIPKYGMVDFALEEILAVESVFHDIEVFICTFHREQAWTRWFSKGNISSCVPREEGLKKLRAIANAPTEKKIEEAIDELKKWSLYEKTPLKVYFERTWFPEIKRWALAYKPAGLLFHTNNGIERINEELKYRYLMENKNCSLSEMMSIVVTNFLPDRYRSYINKNIRMMSLHKKYAENIPEFLHNRPKWIIDFVMEKLDLLDSEDTKDVIINKKSETSYEISSLTSRNILYEVKLDNYATCTCEAFLRNRFLCKHMVLISMKFSEFSISSIILQNEVFRIDETVVNLNVTPTVRKSNEEDLPENNTFYENQKEYGKLASRKSKKK